MEDALQYAWIGWLVLVFLFAVVEIVTLAFVALMLALGSLGGLAAFLLGAPLWLQIIVFFAVSVALILAIRPVLLQRLRRGGDPTPTNVDALLGMTGRVVLDLGEGGGQVKLANGETWTARLSIASAHPATAGEPVIVTAIEGSTAVVVPAGHPPVERNA